MTKVTDIRGCRACGRSAKVQDDLRCPHCGEPVIEPRVKEKKSSTFVVMGVGGIPKETKG